MQTRLIKLSYSFLKTIRRSIRLVSCRLNFYGSIDSTEFGSRVTFAGESRYTNLSSFYVEPDTISRVKINLDSTDFRNYGFIVTHVVDF